MVLFWRISGIIYYGNVNVNGFMNRMNAAVFINKNVQNMYRMRWDYSHLTHFVIKYEQRKHA